MATIEYNGQSAHDREMERLNAIARLLDDCFRVPGTRMRFGLDGIVGLFPGIGDAIMALLGVYLIAVASRMDIPRGALVRMAGNTGLDLAVGAVPFFGDLFDFAFKANRRNVELVRKHLPGDTGQAIDGTVSYSAASDNRASKVGSR